MVSKISIPLKNLKKSSSTSFDLVEKPFDSKLSGEWEGTLKNQDLFLNAYIQEKFKRKLHIVPFNHFSLFYNQGEKKVSFKIVDYATGEQAIKGKNCFEKFLKKFRNTKKRFTFFNISTEEINSEEPRDTLYHAISALYDRKTNKAEIFDSIGSNFSPFKKILKEFFTELYGYNVKIIYLVDRCVSFGKLVLKCDDSLYKYNAEGFCVIWVLWFLELRLANPDIPKEKLIEKALNRLNQGDKVCQLLRGYAQFVDKTISKFSIVRTSSNLIIKPKVSKSPVFMKKDYSFLYVLLASIIGISGAFEVLRRLGKK